MEHLQELKVVITAAASGLGSDIATTLSKNGSKVFICDNDELALKNFSEKNPTINCFHADVSDEAQMKEFFLNIKEQLNEIDVLINNAGVSGSSAKLEDCDFLDWKNTLDINLNGTFLSTKLAIPLMKNKGGSIINMGSTSSFLGNPLRSAYSASKWGLIGLTKTWAMEYGKNKIRVNTICPCSVNGERIDGVIEKEASYRKTSPEKIRKAYLNQTSLKTFVESEEVTAMVVYLLSPMAKKISGQMLVIDGHTESLTMVEE